MNRKDYIRWKNTWLLKLDRESRSHINCIRFGKNETDEHIDAKVKLCTGRCRYKFSSLRDEVSPIFKEYLTEVYDIKRVHRADVLLFTQPYPTVIEIANKSEKKQSIERKRKYWTGLGFEFMEVRL